MARSFELTPADVIRLRLMGIDPGMEIEEMVDPETQLLLDELAWDLQTLDAKAERWYGAWKWTFGALMVAVIIGAIGWVT